MQQLTSRYVAITIENPFTNPFVLIPNAYKALHKYAEINGLKFNQSKDVIECFEKVYCTDGITYMDVCIAIK